MEADNHIVATTSQILQRACDQVVRDLQRNRGMISGSFYTIHILHGIFHHLGVTAAATTPSTILPPSQGLVRNRDPMTTPSSSGSVSRAPTSTSDQLRSLFGPRLYGKRKRALVDRPTKKMDKQWTHTFVCMADASADEVPSMNIRMELKLAGLGEKRFPVHLYGDPESLDIALKSQFPPLADTGGYDLLITVRETGKGLNVIPCPPEGYCAEYLKSVVGNSKIFIRPLQKSLQTSCPTPMEEVCIYRCLLLHLQCISYTCYALVDCKKGEVLMLSENDSKAYVVRTPEVMHRNVSVPAQ